MFFNNITDMPPTNEELMVVQYDMFMHEAKQRILEAENYAEEGNAQKRVLSDNEREKLADAIGRELTAEEGAKLRFFFTHLPATDWDSFRKAAADGDGAALKTIIDHYHAFSTEFDAQVANMDPDTVTALTELCESQRKSAAELLKNEDEAHAQANARVRDAIQRITEELVKMVRNDDRIEE
jgi:hypothetical protein